MLRSLLACGALTLLAQPAYSFGHYCGECGSSTLATLFSTPAPMSTLDISGRQFLVSAAYPPEMTAELQDDSNLVVTNQDGVAVWSSKTQGSGATRLVLQADGNVVMFNKAGSLVWETSTTEIGHGPFCLTLTADGSLTIWDSQCEWSWRNGVVRHVHGTVMLDSANETQTHLCTAVEQSADASALCTKLAKA
ncbi:Aste57867_19696 [Aphanomyces stellatus]|uniref:Aste57867_19696 protein n=1 Tax=Aphanomyces stellatus TaxID=120398 RepID=A0A485LDA6_9STRA|nr:hypothetical protein As57867_019631 [Aphanomyces stellatus]VFT96396.1 Aste57867_19696 [Aphanomyces stellatus]